jgi:hypothetical protein
VGRADVFTTLRGEPSLGSSTTLRLPIEPSGTVMSIATAG